MDRQLCLFCNFVAESGEELESHVSIRHGGKCTDSEPININSKSRKFQEKSQDDLLSSETKDSVDLSLVKSEAISDDEDVNESDDLKQGMPGLTAKITPLTDDDYIEDTTNEEVRLIL